MKNDIIISEDQYLEAIEIVKEDKYINALKIIREYHVQSKIIEVGSYSKIKVKFALKVRCLNNYAMGHKIKSLTIGKEYDIIKNPYKFGLNVNWKNKYEFAIIDDNNKKRYYKYTNLSKMWEFIY